MTDSSDDLARSKERAVRSFVLRAGRMTRGQQNAWDRLWPRYGLSLADGLVDRQQLFGRQAPLNLEIGFGMGQSLAEMAEAAPDQDFIGVEVYRPGCGALLMEMEGRGLDNIRVYRADALDVLSEAIPEASLDRVLILFPDPWPKKKHHKRRLIQPDFVATLHRYIRPGGLLHIATDWEPYAEHILEVMNDAAGYRNLSEDGTTVARPADRPLTKFEKRGEARGHGVADMLFERQ